MSITHEIESRIAILDLVNRYVQTKKAGVNYKALCPFHNEKTPSFVISPVKNICKCFSCNKGGGPINFLMEIENIEFREAVSILAKEAGIETQTQFFAQKVEKSKDIHRLYKLASQWYHDQLYSNAGKEALEYLQNRGLSDETIKNFQIGFSHSSRVLFDFLLKQEFDNDFLMKSGLFLNPNRDKFFGRVIFPIANTFGNPVAFTGRILKNGEPKYLNSPASRIFNKSSILYGLHLAKQTISKTGEVFVVEGQMDTISLHQAGIVNAVGISGTALTQDHIRILKRFVKVVYLALDADDAGIKATFLSIENLLNSDLEIRIILIPNGKDPDEFLKSGGNFSALREESLSVIDYYILMGKKEYNLDTLVGKKQLIEKCLEMVARIVSPIEVDFYIKYLSQKFDISRNALYQDFYHKKRQITAKINKETVEKIERYKPKLLDLLATYIYKFSLLDLFFEKFAYTKEQLLQIQDSGLLYNIITTSDLEDAQEEELKAVDLYIDESFGDMQSDVVQRQFFDLLATLHQMLLENEKKEMLSRISQESPEYLKIYTYLVQKAKKLGIQPGQITF